MVHCPNCGQQFTPGSEGDSAATVCPHCGYALTGQGAGSGISGAVPLPVAQPITPEFAEQVCQVSEVGYGAASASAPAAVANAAPEGTRVPEGVQAPVAAAYGAGMEAPCGPAPAPAAPLPKGMAVAALVLGIVAIAGCWIPFFNLASIVLGAVAFILGIVVLARVRKGRAGGKGMGIAGLVLGILSVVFAALIVVATVLFMQSTSNSGEFYHGIFPPSESAKDDKRESPAVTSDDNAPWTSLNFTLGDGRFQVGTTTLEELGEQSGWTLDLAAQGYPDGYIVQSAEEVVAISLANPEYPDDIVQVSVVNRTKDQRDLMKCQLSEVSVINESGRLSCTLAEGVGLGSTMDQVIDAYGEPTYRFGAAEEGYWSINYDTDDYDKGVEFTAMEGIVVDRLLVNME